jgi:hypothetical protein
MVSISNWLTLGLIGAGVLAFYKLGGASGIGRKIGGGFNDFIGGITSSVTPQSSIQQIVSDLGLQNKVEGLPLEDRPITDPEKGLVSLAGVLQHENYGGVINVESQTFKNQFTTQPLGFAITPSGKVKTGTVGLGQSTIAAQAELSKKYGIPTFDVAGNISSFAGLTAGNIFSGGGSSSSSSKSSESTGGQSGGATGKTGSSVSNASASHKAAFGR